MYEGFPFFPGHGLRFLKTRSTPGVIIQTYYFASSAERIGNRPNSKTEDQISERSPTRLSLNEGLRIIR